MGFWGYEAGKEHKGRYTVPSPKLLQCEDVPYDGIVPGENGISFKYKLVFGWSELAFKKLPWKCFIHSKFVIGLNSWNEFSWLNARA